MSFLVLKCLYIYTYMHTYICKYTYVCTNIHICVHFNKCKFKFTGYFKFLSNEIKNYAYFRILVDIFFQLVWHPNMAVRNGSAIYDSANILFSSGRHVLCHLICYINLYFIFILASLLILRLVPFNFHGEFSIHIHFKFFSPYFSSLF